MRSEWSSVRGTAAGALEVPAEVARARATGLELFTLAKCNASPQELLASAGTSTKLARRMLLGILHPDRLGDLSADDRKLVDLALLLVSTAFNALMSPHDESAMLTYRNVRDAAAREHAWAAAHVDRETRISRPSALVEQRPRALSGMPVAELVAVSAVHHPSATMQHARMNGYKADAASRAYAAVMNAGAKTTATRVNTWA